MSRWTSYLLWALSSLADTGHMRIHPQSANSFARDTFSVDLGDDRSVQKAFRSIVESDWARRLAGLTQQRTRLSSYAATDHDSFADRPRLGPGARPEPPGRCPSTGSVHGSDHGRGSTC